MTGDKGRHLIKRAAQVPHTLSFHEERKRTESDDGGAGGNVTLSCASEVHGPQLLLKQNR